MELVTVRNVFQYCLLNQSPNGHKSTDWISWLDNYNVPSTLVAWPYDGNTVLAQILTGHPEELSFYFYELCGIHSRNWLNTPSIHPPTSSSSSKANTHIDGAGPNPKSHTSIIPVLNMDIKAILEKSRVKKSASAAPLNIKAQSFHSLHLGP